MPCSSTWGNKDSARARGRDKVRRRCGANAGVPVECAPQSHGAVQENEKACEEHRERHGDEAVGFQSQRSADALLLYCVAFLMRARQEYVGIVDSEGQGLWMASLWRGGGWRVTAGGWVWG